MTGFCIGLGFGAVATVCGLALLIAGRKDYKFSLYTGLLALALNCVGIIVLHPL